MDHSITNFESYANLWPPPCPQVGGQSSRTAWFGGLLIPGVTFVTIGYNRDCVMIFREIALHLFYFLKFGGGVIVGEGCAPRGHLNVLT